MFLSFLCRDNMFRNNDHLFTTCNRRDLIIIIFIELAFLAFVARQHILNKKMILRQSQSFTFFPLYIHHLHIHIRFKIIWRVLVISTEVIMLGRNGHQNLCLVF